MNQLQLFKNRKVEVFEWKDIILFNPYDVGACLGIKNVRDSINNFNKNQVVKLTNSDVGITDFRKLNNAGENFLTESGVYRLILKSRKPEAEEFQCWVTDVVLPSIRKHGAYATEELLDNPDFAIKIFMELKEEREAKKALEIQLDYSKDWYSIKRVAKINGVSWNTFDWKKLKRISKELGYEVKKIFDANYGEVNTYHCDVWEKAYPKYETR